MIRTGKVVGQQGDALKVCFSRPEACESCDMCGSGRNDTMVTLRGNARVGDSVLVDMPEARVLKVSAITYLLPLSGLLLGLFLGDLLFKGKETAVFASGLGLMALALAGLKWIDVKLGTKASWQPKIVSVIPAEEEEAPKAPSADLA